MRPYRSFRSRQAGVALIVVLWAVALISAAMLGLAAILQRQLGQEVAALQNSRAMLVAESGLQMALNPQIQPAMVAEASRILSGELQSGWSVPVRFEVGAEDLRGEDGKINLNAFDVGSPGGREFARRILTNLLGSWEVNPTTSSAFLDGLLDFLDPDRNPTGTNEATEERTRNAPMETLDELERVWGWDQVMAESRVKNWREKFTIFGSGKLSLKNADADVIEAWLGLNPGAAANFVQNRLGPDQIFGTQDDQVNVALLGNLSPEALARINTGSEDLWRVTSTGYVGEVKRKLVALISRNPPLIKARWTEDRPE
jgi:type II secretory pathway component PulK